MKKITPFLVLLLSGCTSSQVLPNSETTIIRVLKLVDASGIPQVFHERSAKVFASQDVSVEVRVSSDGQVMLDARAWSRQGDNLDGDINHPSEKLFDVPYVLGEGNLLFPVDPEKFQSAQRLEFLKPFWAFSPVGENIFLTGFASKPITLPIGKDKACDQTYDWFHVYAPSARAVQIGNRVLWFIACTDNQGQKLILVEKQGQGGQK